jgi:hypothetical protein
MKSRTVFSTFALVLAILACNLPTKTPIAAATQTPIILVVSATLPPASQTPLPTYTPLATFTSFPTVPPTPSVPTVYSTNVAVNCRLGPGQGWIVVSGLGVGESSKIIGKNASETWWYIVDPNDSSSNCWVAMSVTTAAGNLSGIPIVKAQKASVTKVTVSVDPKTISVPGCVGPILPSKFKATIEVNGPVTVEWHFSTQQDGAMSTMTTDFDAFGEKTVSAEYTPSLVVGTYWVRLIINDPNDIQDEAKYKIECP